LLNNAIFAKIFIKKAKSTRNNLPICPEHFINSEKIKPPLD